MRSYAATAGVVVLALCLAACGRKGPPLPPGARVPQPVTDFSGLIQDDGSIELGWRNPNRRVDNVRLRDLTVERLYRAEDAGVGEPKSALLSRGRVPGYAEILTIRFPESPKVSKSPAPPPPLPEGVKLDGNRVHVTDRAGLTPGRRYTYVVVAEDSVGRESAPSSRVSLTMIPPAEPPAPPSARAGEGEVRLAWTAPTRLTDGEPLTGTVTYEVLRAAGPEGSLASITPTPLTEPSFVDRGVANDQTYSYAIRPIRREGSTTVRGRPSERAEATPRDVTPPSAPRNLVGIPSVGVVRLRWDASPERDVARYVVYRVRPGGERERIGSVESPSTVFVDTNLASGTYRYVVTAQDTAMTPNESAGSNEVSVNVP